MKNNNTEQLLVLKKLFSYLYKLDVIEYGRLQEIKYHINRYEEVDVEIDIMYDIEAEPWEESILVEISDIYEIAKEHNIYFFDCPYKVYENYFESRKNKFLEEYIDATELDFLLAEVNYFSLPNRNRFFTIDNKEYYYHSYFKNNKKYILSLKRKLEFLNKKLSLFNFNIDLSVLNKDDIFFDEIKAVKIKSTNDVNVTVKNDDSKPTKNSKEIKSFKLNNYIGNNSKLVDLRSSLIEKKLISKNTSLKDFKNVFKCEEIEKPIIWTGNISELTYFIKQLHNNLKYVSNVKQEIWVVTINCFIQENNKQYNREKLRTQKIPATSKKIDKALNTLK